MYQKSYLLLQKKLTHPHTKNIMLDQKEEYLNNMA